MFMIIEWISFFLFFSTVNSQRYYAFVETLFVIDRAYFPPLSSGLSYEHYIQIVTDTANIILQTQNDLDIKIEVIVSDVQYHNIIQPFSQQPYAYADALKTVVSNYEKYDSVVLLSYQPWEGKDGAQGYALLKGVCDPRNKIMYLLPYQNAGFYLAHELGHQLGLVHQKDTSCYTSSYMSVMTRSHTTSYEQARWTRCENDFINSHICQYDCLFNKPDNYKIVKNKYSTMPGRRMNNDQQAKMIEPAPSLNGEARDNSYRSTNIVSRCLYFQYFTDSAGGTSYMYSPMLPGSTCGEGSVCYLDKCVPESELDSSILTPQEVNEYLDLTKHCKAGSPPSELMASNKDPRQDVQCVDWENDNACEPSQPCPADNDESTRALYIRHICCAKCSKKPMKVLGAFNHARRNSKNTASVFSFIVLFFSFY